MAKFSSFSRKFGHFFMGQNIYGTNKDDLVFDAQA